MEPYAFNIFGSENSMDYDVMYFLPEIPEIKECKSMAVYYENDFPIIDKKVNVNFAVVKDGRIVDVYKGSPDECNNSIFATYKLHKQYHENQVSVRVVRDVNLKIARSLRIVLTFLSRTQYREEVKAALRSHFKMKIAVLKHIHFETITDLGKNNQDLVDFKKQVAFQFAQAHGLMDGYEIYTKKGCVRQFPELRAYLMRTTSAMTGLNVFKNHFLEEVINRYSHISIEEKPAGMSWSDYYNRWKNLDKIDS